MRASRNIALCFDGTWNSDDAESPTNVVKTWQAIRLQTSAGVDQLTYYDRGVGTGRFDRFRGGVLGLGLARNVELAYEWLTATFRPGDRLFLFGYSRGAYTARSLAGLVGLCSIPDAERCALAGCQPVDAARRGMAVYRMRSGPARDERAARHRETFCTFAARPDPSSPQPGAAAGRPASAVAAAETVSVAGEGQSEAAVATVSNAVPGVAVDPPSSTVHFVGVWDTVGALGVPITWLNWVGARRHRFHDVRLDRHIVHACHAVSVDEGRRPFAPTLWLSAPAPGQKVEQLWFPGVHGDVGGGRSSTGLSDGALLWMWTKAFAAGLAFEPEAAHALAPDPFGPQGKMSAVYRIWGRHDRPVGEGGRERPSRRHRRGRTPLGDPSPGGPGRRLLRRRRPPHPPACPQRTARPAGARGPRRGRPGLPRLVQPAVAAGPEAGRGPGGSTRSLPPRRALR